MSAAQSPTQRRARPAWHRIQHWLALVPASGLILGGGLWWFGYGQAARFAFAGGTAPVLVVLVVTSVLSLRRGEVGLDIVAAIAMAGALLGRENLAGVVVALMYAGGQALEAVAQGSAEREMKALLGRVARTAQRRRDGQLETVPIEAIRPGDVLLIRAGEALPVDGLILDDAAVLDESALTGEAMPVRRAGGAAAASGAANLGDAFELQALRTAADSTYAGVVRLVEEARRSKAPMSRLADRYAMVFLAATVILAGGAWVIAGEWRRALAVLVVATPCPLILAVPVAIVSGMSRCAARGVLLKTAQALETLAKVRVLLIDKTGTLTRGRATLRSVVASGEVLQPELLFLAGSLAQASQHVMSQAVTEAARGAGQVLLRPDRIAEAPGEGVSGRVGGREVVLGHPRFVAQRTDPLRQPEITSEDGSSTVAVGVDGAFAGELVFVDEIRPDAVAALNAFRQEGIGRIVLVTGDRPAVAEPLAARLGIDRLVCNASPGEKLDAVRTERPFGAVLMVGDGINDAPALASADVGVALGAGGAAAAAEAADAVVLVDRLDRVAEAIRIAKRTRAVALQSVSVGLGLSGLGMLAAALGYLPPLAGALTQEVIDVAVILNALRCLGEGRGTVAPVQLTRIGSAGAATEVP